MKYLKKTAIVIVALLILVSVFEFTRVNTIKTNVKAAKSQEDKDLITQYYANYVLISSIYLDNLISVLNGNQQDIRTFAKTASIYFDHTKSLKLDGIAINEYNNTLGNKTGELIKTINLNLQQYQIDLYENLPRIDLKNLDLNTLIKNNLILSNDLQQHSSLNLYDIETVYKTMEQDYGKNKIYSFLEKLNKEIITMDNQIKATPTQRDSFISKETSHPPLKMLSISKVKTYIENSEKGKNVSDLHIISVKNIGEVGAAFASFKLDGKSSYVTIFSSKEQGTGTAVFTVSDFKKDPIQYMEQSGENGYTAITGVIDNKSGIKKIIITFSNGQVREVPVVEDKFWFFGKAGSTKKEVYSREVIGVTVNGSIVVKKNKP